MGFAIAGKVTTSLENRETRHINHCNLSPNTSIFLQYSGLCAILSGVVKTQKIKVKTTGNCDIVNITEQVSEAIALSPLTAAIAALALN